MNLHDIVSQLIVDTKGSPDGNFLSVTADSSLGAFLPELVLCVTMVLMLLVRLFRWGRHADAFYLALLGSACGFVLAAPWQLLSGLAGVERMEIFGGMLVYDGFSVFIRSVLLGFAVLFVIFTKISGIPDREDGPDIYTLVLGATLGMCLMASANHLLMVFMSVEMASVPSYVLAGMLKGRRLGSEAALKYSVYGAGAAGVMLYGISLVAGLLNTVHLPTMAVQLAETLPGMASEDKMVLALGGLMIGVGLAFKLSAVPFHFWCPDVFEGASAEVAAFLSIASKAAALALLVRVAIGFGTIAPAGVQPGELTAQERALAAARPPTPAPDGSASVGLFAVSDTEPAAAEPNATAAGGGEAAAGEAGGAADDRATRVHTLAPVRNYIGKLIALLAVITCTFGNLAAYGQDNMKRLLAYSTIAHAGYMMMALPPVMALAEVSPRSAEAAVGALAIYIFVYLFMNLGAFAVVAFLRNAMHSEQISDYAGLLRSAPGVVICLALILFSLIGLPPLAGFLGKFAIFAALMDGYSVTGQPYLMVVLVVGGINTAISLFYYLRVVKVMTMEPEAEGRTAVSLPLLSAPGAFVLAVTVPTIVLLACWNWLNQMALAAAQHLLT